MKNTDKMFWYKPATQSTLDPVILLLIIIIIFPDIIKASEQLLLDVVTWQIFTGFLSFPSWIFEQILSIDLWQNKTASTGNALLCCFPSFLHLWQWHSLSSRTHLGADEQVGHTGSVLLQLGHPLLTHILETGRIYHREADEEDIGHGVGQRPEAVVVLLEGEETHGDVHTQPLHDLFLCLHVWEITPMNYWGQ